CSRGGRLGHGQRRSHQGVLSMYRYQITMALEGRALGVAFGNYDSDWQAIDTALEMFHDARCVTVRRIAP
ncbi:MAG: hypothetical protein RR574_17270, partial [Comamonas sp.]